jgi:DNA-binding response OmpR family regulator
VKTILIVDDEPKIIRLARDYLENAGFRVVGSGTGSGALEIVHNEAPDLVLLDLGLPDMDGLDVCRQLRTASAVPIIMLTARDEETDKLVGLELGADDYITKPFSPKELVARVRAVLRRAASALEPRQRLKINDLELDLPSMRVRRGSTSIDLTPTEFELLAALAAQPGRIFTRAQLLDAVHGVAIESYERAIDAHIKNIRKKLEPNPREPEYILTVYGVGYRLNDER